MLLFRICAVALLVSIAVERPAAAQSFFEKLFGIGQKSAEPPPLPPVMPSYRAPLHVPSPRSTMSSPDIETMPRRPRGQIRTVCVRMCDGYYFPLSSSTSARRLTADNARCKATCGSDSRLFYSTNDGDPDPATMIDLTGRRYDQLDTAFAYRKALRPGCACRPPPWSASEKVRHFQYALEAAQEEMQKVAAAELEPSGETALAEKPTGKPDVEDAEDGRRSELAAEITTSPASERRRLRTIAVGGQETSGYRTPNSPPRRARNAAEVRPAPTRQRYSNAASSQPSGGLFGFGGKSKYVWPGDAR